MKLLATILVAFNLSMNAQTTDFNVELPKVFTNKVSIADFGAKSDNSLCTDAINKAIKAIHDMGGGSVIVPKGTWLTGPITLLSNVNLHLQNGAIIKFTKRIDQYPVMEINRDGNIQYSCQPQIYAHGATDISITGKGTIEGSGERWRPVKKNRLSAENWDKLVKQGGILSETGTMWFPDSSSWNGYLAQNLSDDDRKLLTKSDWEKMKTWLRPVMVSMTDCKRILLSGVNFKNSPHWCIHTLMCTDITIDSIDVYNPQFAQNGDGLDIESSKNVIVKNSIFDAASDAICLRSGKDDAGRKRGIATENININNNIIFHGHGGIVLGSEMSGGIRNVWITNCSFTHTDTGIRFKTTRGRGGIIEDIYVNNILMNDLNKDVISFDMFFLTKNDNIVKEVNEETPIFRNFTFKNITCSGARKALIIKGLPEMPVSNITIDGFLATKIKEMGNIRYAKNVKITNAIIDKDFNIENCENVTTE
ncbi:MAG: glycoside hydrolase family 28 protein [Bacteroidaceae bacterium]|nr:glycoside hydrolase family 28 protein [Bacteroidaceae bacterium]